VHDLNMHACCNAQLVRFGVLDWCVALGHCTTRLGWSVVGAFVFDCATAVFACVVVHFVSAVLLQRPSVIQGVTDSLLVHTSTKGGRFGAASTQNHNSVAANMM
jgi:hypothetical protein